MRVPDAELKRWTRIEYERLVDKGVLGPGDKIELIDGLMLVAEPQSSENDRRIAALVARIEHLQRGAATTRRDAHYATVSLHLETPLVTIAQKHGHGPLHGVGVALKWLGIGAVYALAIGTPVAVLLALIWFGVRVVRRRRENALLEI